MRRTEIFQTKDTVRIKVTVSGRDYEYDFPLSLYPLEAVENLYMIICKCNHIIPHNDGE